MRFIVAGVGFGEQHLRWLSECSGVDIVGLYVRTRTANADEIAERFGVEHVSTDLPGLIATSRADALVVATSPRSHAALLHAALEVGLVAISDKPLTADVASARALAIATQHATERGIVTFQWRQHPGVRYLRACMHRKLLGTVSHLELRFDHDFLARRETGTPWRHDAALAGAGTLGDQGVHLFDLLRHITADEWIVLTAHGLRLWPERTFGAESIACETEDVADVVLRSASGGQTAFVHASRAAIGIRALQIRIFGTTGSVDLVVHPDTGTGSLRHLSVDGETHSESFETPSLNPYAALFCEHSNIAGDVASFADGLAAQVLLNRSVELMNYTSNLEVS